ncbi:hypothetical protein [uncultured Chryseobacterium sp.]|nr:hypothetical protein [uncultured Chryseobacterium sp.]
MPEHKSIPITPLAGEYGLGMFIHPFSGEEEFMSELMPHVKPAAMPE